MTKTENFCAINFCGWLKMKNFAGTNLCDRQFHRNHVLLFSTVSVQQDQHFLSFYHFLFKNNKIYIYNYFPNLIVYNDYINICLFSFFLSFCYCFCTEKTFECFYTLADSNFLFLLIWYCLVYLDVFIPYGYQKST